jgi:hypothetical protein
MVYGNITGTICLANAGGTWGISFVPSGAPAGGNYSYIQLINSDTITYTKTGGSVYTCTHNQAIDQAYPYRGIIPNTVPPQALDAPGVGLPSTYNTVNRSFNATMFLMWTSALANSIPVTIGFQTWTFNGTANCTTSCGSISNWTATTNGSPGPTGTFTQSNGTQTTDGYSALVDGYPIWSGVSAQSCH